ncbi:MAG TPA: DUF2269 family protein [Bacillota bacterium]|nr:DUF2269 family protein [Bacillota bacterium]
MDNVYSFLVVVHIFSAIFGVGSLFILSAIIRMGKNMQELRFSYEIFNKVHFYAVVGTISLLISGLTMGALRHNLFNLAWVQISALLIIIFFIIGPIWLRPIMKPILELVQTHKGEEIPEEYYRLYRRMIPVEIAIAVIFILITILMILKP